MIRKIFKKSIVAYLLSLSICTSSNYTHAAPPPETGIAKPFLNSSHLSSEISNIDNLRFTHKASRKKLMCDYIYFLDSEYNRLPSDVAEEKKESYKKYIEELDLELKYLKEKKISFINRAKIYDEAKKIFSALSNQLKCVMQILYPENLQNCSPEEYVALNQDVYSYISGNFFINLDTACYQINNLMERFLCLNDSSLNHAVEWTRYLHRNIVLSNTIVKQSSDYTSEPFVCVRKLELINWINSILGCSLYLESLFE